MKTIMRLFKRRPPPVGSPLTVRYCLETGKQRFNSQSGADKMLKLIGQKRYRNQAYLKTFLCPHCHSWHLTSRGEKVYVPPPKKPVLDIIREQIQEWKKGLYAQI